MTALLGWTIIVVVFGVFSLGVLWPGLWLMRRAHPSSRGLRWGYAAAAVVCSLVLWYVTPLAVHGLFGRVAP